MPKGYCRMDFLEHAAVKWCVVVLETNETTYWGVHLSIMPGPLQQIRHRVRDKTALLQRQPAVRLAVTMEDAWKRLWKYRYGLAVASVLLATALRLFLEAQYGVTAPYITFYPAIMLVAVFGGAGPGVLATMLSAVLADLCLLEPRGQVAIAHLSDQVALGVFVAVGLLFSTMAGALYRIKERERRLIEQALRDTEHRYHLVVTGVKDSRAGRPRRSSAGTIPCSSRKRRYGKDVRRNC
jgi:K+-sensing histidine kinase KdpD